jgi:hypothetical protein
VKGHQDNSEEYNKLSNDAKLNVKVDNLASAHLWSSPGCKPKARLPHLHKQQVPILINGHTHPSGIDKQLRWHINGSHLKAYLQSTLDEPTTRVYGKDLNTIGIISFQQFDSGQNPGSQQWMLARSTHASTGCPHHDSADLAQVQQSAP